MDYYTIDFETANSSLTSACSIGIVGVKNKKVLLKKYFLINPEEEFSEFAIAIHHITKEDVKEMPTFRYIWEDIKDYFDNTIVFSHNSGFDFLVLKSLLEKYSIEKPVFQFGCTVKIAKALWCDGEVPNHKLNTLARFFDYDFNHHNALSDASVCVEIINRGLRIEQVSDIVELYNALSLKFGYFGPNNFYNSFKLKSRYKVKKYIDNDKIANKLIIVSGSPDHMKRRELINIIIGNGGFIDTKVTNKCDYFVKLSNCDNNKLDEVYKLRKQGVKIKIFTEDSILALVK